MVPKKENKKMVLYCAKCGYVKPFRSKRPKEAIVTVKKGVDVVVESGEEKPEKEAQMKEAFLEAFDIAEEEEPAEE